jgi:hypothetical protein
MSNNGSCVNSLGFIFNEAKFCFKKYNVIKLRKCDFFSSSMSVSINREDAWNGLLNGITNLIDGQLIITVSKCNKIHSFAVKLCSVDYCVEKEQLKLFVKYPLYGKNKKDKYCKYDNCDKCIKVKGKSPIVYDKTNYETMNNGTCIMNYANLTYDDLKNTKYTNVKFYYDNNYLFNPCFISA